MESDNLLTSKQQTPDTSKLIIIIGKILQFFSESLAANHASKLFITPFKHKIPGRELHIDLRSIQQRMHILSIKKEIVVYEYGNGSKSVLLANGWSGRGTQLFKIADRLLELGYKTISFDAPAHGKATGKTTNLEEFIETILF